MSDSEYSYDSESDYENDDFDYRKTFDEIKKGLSKKDNEKNKKKDDDYYHLDDFFDEHRNTIYELIKNKEKHDISFYILNNNRKIGYHFDLLLHHDKIINIFKLFYNENKTKKQLEYYNRDSNFIVTYNGIDILNLFPTVNNTYDLNNLSIFLNNQEFFDRTDLSYEINQNRSYKKLEYKFESYGFPQDRVQNLDEFGQRLQELLDQFYRSNVDDKRNEAREELINMIQQKNDDGSFYRIRFINDSNHVRPDNTISFEYRNRENLLKIINNSNQTEEKTDFITSANSAVIVSQNVIDASITYFKLKNFNIRNNQGGLFNFCYREFYHEELNKIFRYLQIFTLEELNSPYFMRKYYRHCLISSIYNFMRFDEEKINFDSKVAEIVKVLSGRIFATKSKIKKISSIINKPIGLIELGEYDGKYEKIGTLYENGKNISLPVKEILNKKIIKIGLFKNHYIPIKKVPISKSGLLYLQQEDPYYEFWKDIERIDNQNGELYPRLNYPEKIKYMDTLDLVKVMYQNDMFYELTDEVRRKQMTVLSIVQKLDQQDKEIMDDESMKDLKVEEGDLKIGKQILPQHKKITSEEIEKFCREVAYYNGNLDEEKKNNLFNTLKDCFIIPKDWDDIPDTIVFADCESFPEKVEICKNLNETIEVNKNVAYSIDVFKVRKIELNQYIKGNKEINFKVYTNVFNGLSKYKKVLKTDQIRIIPNNSYDILIRDNVEFKGYFSKDQKSFEIMESNCIEKFCHDMYVERVYGSVRVYFHNAKFDTSLFNNIKNLKIDSKLEKTGTFYNTVYNYNGRKFEVYDSYKLISKPLKDFPKMLNIEAIKEYMPYSIFNRETVTNPKRTLSQLKNDFKNEKVNGKTWKEFIFHIINLKLENILFDENNNSTLDFKKIAYVDILKYSNYYSSRDVKLLGVGLITFAKQLYKLTYDGKKIFNIHHKIMKVVENQENFSITKDLKRFIKQHCNVIMDVLEITDKMSINLFNYITASSFSQDYLALHNCFKGVKSITSSVLKYIEPSGIGGQTMTALNEPHKFEVKNYEINNEEYKKDYEKMKNIIDKKIFKDEQRKFFLKFYKKYVSDYDGVGLYSSAMKLMEGFIIGYPEILQDDDIKNMVNKSLDDICKYINNIKNKSKTNSCHFFVTVNFKNKGIDSLFPLKKVPLQKLLPKNAKINNIYKENTQWENETCRMIVDKYMLKTIIETHKLKPNDYEIEYGLYFPDGYNNTINSVINNLKELRDKYKKEKNPLQEIVKLIMNSSYGKTLIKKSDSKNKFFTGTEMQLNEYIMKNNIICETYTINSNINKKHENVYQLHIKEEDIEHANCAHVGSSILGYSKYIMSKPKIIADGIYRYFHNYDMTSDELDMKIKIFLDKYLENNPRSEEIKAYMMFYTDTDSMMASYECIFLTMSIYEEIYDESLDGEDFGQFHIDFEMSNKKLVNVFGIKAIFLNKKEYCIVLQGYNPETDQFEYEEKMAFKGVQNNRIIDYGYESYPDHQFPVYELFISNKIYEIETIGNDTFKVVYHQKGNISTSATSQKKELNLKQYEKTYYRFLK